MYFPLIQKNNKVSYFYQKRKTAKQRELAISNQNNGYFYVDSDECS